MLAQCIRILHSTEACLLSLKHCSLQHYSTLNNLISENNIKQFIVANTEVVNDGNLTPEIRLRLFTPNCRFWHARPELWPFADPYWAIYWPGGQALARYVLNNPGIAKNMKVLDLGSGCGASAIAAKMSGCASVLANDIDPGIGSMVGEENCSLYLPISVAAIATKLNCELNGLEPLPSVTDDLIGSEPGGWDLVLLGDMFYEEALADRLHAWLRRCMRTGGSRVLIGDPGRAPLEGHGIKRQLHPLAQYELPECVREENYGLTSSTVWCYRPEL